MPRDEGVGVTAHNLNQLGGVVEADVATMKGEADELATRRPHRDAHLYMIEEQLRYRAKESREAMETWYYE